jgi:hypothetical protein
VSDWQPGDLALCVRNSDQKLGTTKLVMPGRIYTVTGIYVSGKCGSLALVLAEAKPSKNPGFHAFLFRKIRPHTPDEEDRETIRLLNSEPVLEPTGAYSEQSS